MREVGQALDDPSFATADLCRSDRPARAADRARTGIVERLRRVADAGPEDWEQVLGVVALLAGLESDDAGSRQRAALTVADAGVPPDALVRALLSETDENVAGALRWALSRSDADVVPALTEALADADVAVRRRAVLALSAVTGSSEALRNRCGG
ncbi:hypothetical protein nbrc107696_46200 [Gordonia spumicola]|uniref:Uncharacterized protein n=1 Tax=Gordonia spumicola TaxID=589161 RepID=A0A7I9VFP1_9ACTN|nr:hypothetical protein nbrc107696_46200 [Gordonia spumicola]